MKKLYKAVVETRNGNRMDVELAASSKTWFREEMAGLEATIIGDTVEEKELFDYIVRNNDFYIFEDKKRWNAARKVAKVEMAKRRGL